MYERHDTQEAGDGRAGPGCVRTHPSEGASYAVALANFEALLHRAEEHTAQQYAGLIEASGATARRMELRRLLQTQLLRHLAGVGLVATKGRPELVNTFKLPVGNSSTQAFLTAAKGMLLKAESERELLVSKGMSETLLDDLAKAVSEFEATNEKSHASRRDHVGAGQGVTACGRRGRGGGRPGSGQNRPRCVKGLSPAPRAESEASWGGR